MQELQPQWSAAVVEGRYGCWIGISLRWSSVTRIDYVKPSAGGSFWKSPMRLPGSSTSEIRRSQA